MSIVTNWFLIGKINFNWELVIKQNQFPSGILILIYTQHFIIYNVK